MNSKQSIQSYGRFKGATWFDEMSKALIFVGGAGGISSHVVFQLARASANIVVVDMDTVEEHNLGGQMYGKSHVGMKKVDAISDVVDYLCGENSITPIDEEITEEDGQWKSLISRSTAVVAGFDNLKARRLVYEEWKINGKENSIFIDARLAAENFSVYIVTKQSTEDEMLGYEATYFSDHERVELPCTFKATTHYGAGVAWWIVTQVSNHLNNITTGTIPRTLSNIEVCGPLSMIDQPILKAKTYAVTD